MPLPRKRSAFSNDLWQRVKERQASVYAASESIRTALHRNARTGAGPKYLFSGLLGCARCGSNFVICGAQAYGCASNAGRGDAVCANRNRVSRRIIEARLLETIRTELFKPEASSLFISEANRLMREADEGLKRARAIAAKWLAAAEREVENILTAIKAGIITIGTKDALETAERDRAARRRELAEPELPMCALEAALPNAVERYTKLVDDMEHTLQRDIARAGYQLKDLLGEFELHPRDGYLEAELAGSFRGLLSLAAEQGARAEIYLVAGTCIHRYLRVRLV